jgi:hypothetical protein
LSLQDVCGSGGNSDNENDNEGNDASKEATGSLADLL